MGRSAPNNASRVSPRRRTRAARCATKPTAVPVRRRAQKRNTLKAISKAAIRRLARRGGVKRLSGLVYEETRRTLKAFLERVLRNAVLAQPTTWSATASRRRTSRRSQPSSTTSTILPMGWRAPSAASREHTSRGENHSKHTRRGAVWNSLNYISIRLVFETGHPVLAHKDLSGNEVCVGAVGNAHTQAQLGWTR